MTPEVQAYLMRRSKPLGMKTGTREKDQIGREDEKENFGYTELR